SADRVFLAAWDEEVLGGWWEGEELRPRRDAAAARFACLESLTGLLAQGAEDEAVVAAGARLPDGYAPGAGEAVAAAPGGPRPRGSACGCGTGCCQRWRIRPEQQRRSTCRRWPCGPRCSAPCGRSCAGCWSASWSGRACGSSGRRRWWAPGWGGR